jgi:Na+/melibiose symporter-like transporter
LLWAVIEAPTYGWTDSSILTAFVVGAVLLGAFLAWEVHTPHPMLNLHFFENPRFSAASGAITIAFFALFGTLFIMTQFLQLVLGYSTVEAGAVLLPQAATIMVAAPLSSGWVRRWGNKWVVTVGLLIVATSYLLLTQLDANATALQVIGVTMLMGLGMGNVMAPCTDSIMGSLPRAKAGVGSAVNDTTRQFGGAVGVAVFGSLLASQYTSEVAKRLATLPASVLAPVKDSIGGALSTVQTSPAAQQHAGEIVSGAKQSFVHGMHAAVVVAMVVLLIAAAIVARFLPHRAREEDSDYVIEPAAMPAVEMADALES